MPAESERQETVKETPTKRAAENVTENPPLPVLYAVGDTVYLDNTAFRITDISKREVTLLDPTLLYPIFRVESKTVFHRLLEQDDRNQAITKNLETSESIAVNASISIPTQEQSNESLSHLAALIQEQTDENISPSHAESLAQVNDTLPTTQLTDYVLSDKNFAGTPSQKFQANLAAIRTLKQRETENRPASEAEKTTLAQYSGWGGLAEYFEPTKNGYHELKNLLTETEYAAARSSTLTAFYTDNRYTDAIWQAVKQLGFTRGNILEPACGTGRFLGRMPTDIRQNSRVYGVEIDSLSGHMAQALYPTMAITVRGYEQTDFQDNVFDLAISNMPFAQIQVHDERYAKLRLPIHDYYFAKTLDKVRPGGLIAFITSSYTLDKASSKFRRYLAERAEFLGAVRLPEEAFQSAGTKVVSDMIFLQKRERPLALIEEPDWLYTAEDEQGLRYNQYFIRHPEQVVGKMVEVSTAYGPRASCKLQMDNEVHIDSDAPIDMAADTAANRSVELETKLQTLLDNAISQIQGQINPAEKYQTKQDGFADVYQSEQSITQGAIPALPNVDNYSYTLYNGRIIVKML